MPKSKKYQGKVDFIYVVIVGIVCTLIGLLGGMEAMRPVKKGKLEFEQQVYETILKANHFVEKEKIILEYNRELFRQFANQPEINLRNPDNPKENYTFIKK